MKIIIKGLLITSFATLLLLSLFFSQANAMKLLTIQSYQDKNTGNLHSIYEMIGNGDISINFHFDLISEGAIMPIRIPYEERERHLFKQSLGNKDGMMICLTVDIVPSPDEVFLLPPYEDYDQNNNTGSENYSEVYIAPKEDWEEIVQNNDSKI